MKIGTKGIFTHPQLSKIKTMSGHIDDMGLGIIFMPDKKHHDQLFQFYGIEAEEGLFLDEGGTFTPIQ